jgi:hypothetical protein
MMEKEIPEPLKGAIKFGLQVESLGSHFTNNMRIYLAMTEGKGELFRRQFAHAILHDTITPEQYTALTNDTRFPDQELLNYWLRDVWSRLYADAPVTEDPVPGS